MGVDAFKGGLTALELAESVRSTYYAVRFWQTQSFHYRRLMQKGAARLGRQVSKQAAKKMAARIAASQLARVGAGFSAILGPLSSAMWIYELTKMGQDWVNKSYQQHSKPFGVIAGMMRELDNRISKDKKFTIHWTEVEDNVVSDTSKVHERKAYDTSSLVGHAHDYDGPNDLVGDGVRWSDAVRFITGKGQSVIFPSLDSMAVIMSNVQTEPAAWVLRDLGILPEEMVAVFLGVSSTRLRDIYSKGDRDDAEELAAHLSFSGALGRSRGKGHEQVVLDVLPEVAPKQEQPTA